MPDTREDPAIEQRDGEIDFVERVAKAIAIVNGHSHPESYADKVVTVYMTGELPPEPEVVEIVESEGGDA